MTSLRIVSVPALLTLAACAPEPESNRITGPLSPVHAVPDTENGGRMDTAEGESILLRGANINSLGEYWQFDPEIPAVFPIVEEELDLYASLGWNVVRLILTWSLVEPEPGVIDEDYLDEVESVVLAMEARGIYTLIDLHQDAWGPSLAARPDENCPDGTYGAVGWDGAPEWATLHEDASRCIPEGRLGLREFSPAVLTAFRNFWADTEGPGGVGIQTRYHSMLGALAKRFSPYDSVVGYDVMNEPNAWSDLTLAVAAPGEGLPDQTDELGDFYTRALQAIRQGEEEAAAPKRMMFFEPSPDWATSPNLSILPDFEYDDQVVYAPHIYQGGITPNPLSENDFQTAVDDAARFGGAPVFIGEWGADPRRITEDDNYFGYHLELQDEFQMGSAMWQWRVACGDPHSALHQYEGISPGMWGLFDVDCPSNETIGFREDLAEVLRYSGD